MKKNNVPMKDGKNIVKSFFAHLKHLWKDPVKTLPEAKTRHKEVKKVCIISLIMFCVPMLLLMLFVLYLPQGIAKIVSNILCIPLIIGGIGTVYSALLFYILKKVTEGLKLRECNNCKEIIGYSDDATYRVLREWVHKKVSTTNNTTHVTQDEMALVEINCTCQNCGTPKTITREFNVAHYLDGNLKFSYELDKLVIDFLSGRSV